MLGGWEQLKNEDTLPDGRKMRKIPSRKYSHREKSLKGKIQIVKVVEPGWEKISYLRAVLKFIVY